MILNFGFQLKGLNDIMWIFLYLKIWDTKLKIKNYHFFYMVYIESKESIK